MPPTSCPSFSAHSALIRRKSILIATEHCETCSGYAPVAVTKLNVNTNLPLAQLQTTTTAIARTPSQ
jgi:hypothetical protein